MKALVQTACVIFAIAAFSLSFWTYTDMSMFGFPDGYVTDYQRAAGTPLTITTWVLAILGAVFVALGFAPIRSRVRAFAWLAALIALILVAIAAYVGVPWYFGTHLGLDNGIGG